MAMSTNKFLGLAVADRSIQAAQVRIAGNSREVGPAAEFIFPEGLTWEDPKALGTALRHFLRHNHFSTSRVVVGVPARWLLAREKEVPPATASIASSMLRLQAERDFPSDLELVYDFAGQTDSTQGRKVLVVAMLKRHMDRIATMVDEAGLSLKAVTSSSLALAAIAGEKTNDVLSVVLWHDAAELVIRGKTAPRLLKHMALSGVTSDGFFAAMTALGSEVQRALAWTPAEDGISRTAVLWDGVGMEPAVADALFKRSGIEMRVAAELPLLGVARQTHVAEPRKVGAAVAVALAATRGRLVIDFVHTRLAPPKVQRVNRKYVLAGIAAAIIIGLFTYQELKIQDEEKKVSVIQVDLKRKKDIQKIGDVATEKYTTARQWFDDGRQPIIEAMNELALLFPTDNRILATSLTFRENQKATLAVKAVADTTPEDVKRLVAGRTNFFKDVELKDIKWQVNNRTGQRTGVTFNIQFNLVHAR
jgi:hypothetical protein